MNKFLVDFQEKFQGNSRICSFSIKCSLGLQLVAWTGISVVLFTQISATLKISFYALLFTRKSSHRSEVCGSTNFTSADNPRPQASGPRTVRVHNCNGDMSADCPQTVRKQGRITLYPIDNAQGPTQSNRVSYVAYCSVQIWISSQLAENWYIGTSVLGWSCKQYSWLQIRRWSASANVFGRSADRPRPQENLRIRVRGYPQSAHLCHRCNNENIGSIRIYFQEHLQNSSRYPGVDTVFQQLMFSSQLPMNKQFILKFVPIC